MLEKDLIESPHDYDFYQAVYALQNQAKRAGFEQAAVGRDNFPSLEAVRFSVSQQVGYAGAPISQVSEVADSCQLDLAVTFLGLTGINGALPFHYTEAILQRMRHKDHALRDFFDMLNNRIIALYYRSWEKYRFAIGYEQNACMPIDPISGALTNLTGAEDDLELYFAGYFKHAIRNEANLRNMLQEIVAGDVVIKTLQGQWISMADDEVTRLCSRQQPEGAFACLGVNSMVGGQMWDLSSKVEIILKPSDATDFDQLKPNSAKRKTIENLVGSYLGPAVKSSLKVEADYDAIVKPRLGAVEMQLGFGAMLLLDESQSSKPSTVCL